MRRLREKNRTHSRYHLDKGPGPGRAPSSEMPAQTMGLGLVGATRQGLETKVFSLSHCLCIGWQTVVYQVFVFLSPWELPFFPLKTQTPTPFPLATIA